MDTPTYIYHEQPMEIYPTTGFSFNLTIKKGSRWSVRSPKMRGFLLQIDS